jgi:hypothetical protein
MKCPNCDVGFHPQMENHLIGENKRGINVFVFYQMCPECKEPITGAREARSGEYFPSSSDVEGLALLTKSQDKQFLRFYLFKPDVGK